MHEPLSGDLADGRGALADTATVTATATASATSAQPSAAASHTAKGAPHLAAADIDTDALARIEAAAPGYARALLDAECARDAQKRRFRLARLACAMVVAVAAIGCGQWALVHGASQEALYLSGAGLAGIIATFLQHE